VRRLEMGVPNAEEEKLRRGRNEAGDTARFDALKEDGACATLAATVLFGVKFRVIGYANH
jgi:hypothetical protein